jgi:hypothetical protein
MEIVEWVGEMILTLKKEMQLHWIMMIMSLILSRVFDLFAPIYGLFYNYQKVHYKAVIDGVQDRRLRYWCFMFGA